MRFLLQCKRHHSIQGQEHLLRVPLRAQQTQLIYIITALKPRRNSAGVFHLHGYAAGRGNIPEKIA